MNKDLYFIKLIANALRGGQSSIRMNEALEEIHRLGQQPQYRQGYLQFLEFIKKIKEAGNDFSSPPDRRHEDLIQDLILQCGLGLIEGESPEAVLIQKFIEVSPKWNNEHARLRHAVRDAESLPDSIEIIIDIDGKPLKRIPWTDHLVVDTISGVSPGNLSVRLNTGRVLWQGELTTSDLFLSEAFPNEELKLAADTGEDFAKMSRRFHLLDGQLIITVYPEIESGSLEIRIRESAVE
jgi:hypothetical protein